jgi:hypothetical protein
MKKNRGKIYRATVPLNYTGEMEEKLKNRKRNEAKLKEF